MPIGRHGGRPRGPEPCRIRVPRTIRSFRRRRFVRPKRWCESVRSRMERRGAPAWSCSWPRTRPSPMPRRAGGWAFTPIRPGTGAAAGRRRDSPWRTVPAPGGRGSFPPSQVAAVKAVACELPARHERPLSRLFVPDIIEILLAEEVVASISASTVWRILDADALKPWRHRNWIFPRDPLFYERAAPALDLYAGRWHGRPLRGDEFVLSADEKTSIQTLRRLHPSRLVGDGRGRRVEHEYERRGVWAYLAAWDVHRARLYDRVETTTGIEPFGRLVDQVMRREPYRSARRVFWIVDGGGSHHRSTFPERLRSRHPNAEAVILPVHASWLNQVEIYFSIVQRKVLTPNEFSARAEAEARLLAFGERFRREAEPFQWRFTRDRLREYLRRLAEKSETPAPDVQKNPAA